MGPTISRADSNVTVKKYSPRQRATENVSNSLVSVKMTTVKSLGGTGSPLKQMEGNSTNIHLVSTEFQ